MTLFQRIRYSTAPAWTVLIRLAVGAVVLSEGIQKYVNPADVGAGRFETIGLPDRLRCAVCGSLVILGLFTRIAVIPLLTTAIVTTKIPNARRQGLWAMAHEACTDYAMLLGLIFLLIVGAGRWSVDVGPSPIPVRGK